MSIHHSGFIDIGDTSLWYERAGRGDAVILIHADGLDHRMWDGLFPVLSRRFDTVRFDMRGFGKSPLPGKFPYAFETDLDRLRTALGIERAHLVGLSLGAATAIDCCLAYPDGVSSLTLIDPGLGGYRYSDTTRAGLADVVRLAREGDLEAAKRRWLELGFFTRSLAIPDVAGMVRTMVGDTSGYRWYGVNQPLKRIPAAAESLGRLRVPTLIISGEDDLPDFRAAADYIHRSAAGSRYVVVPHAGHLSLLDNPEPVTAAVMDFLTGSADGGSDGSSLS
jgi:3-oxoadipate enol-lactonase